MMWFFNSGMGVFGWIIMFLIWAGIIWLIIWLASQNNSRNCNECNMSPEKLLKSKYVNGEISLKKYREMKNELENN